MDEVIEQVLEDLQSELGYTQTQASTFFIVVAYPSLLLRILSFKKYVMRYIPTSPSSLNGSILLEITYALSIQKNNQKTVIHYHTNDLLEFYKDFDDPEDYYVDDGSRKISSLFINKEDMQQKLMLSVRPWLTKAMLS